MKSASPRKLGVSDDPMAGRIGLRECLDTALKQSEGLIDKVLDSLAGKGEKTHGMTGKSSPMPGVQAAVQTLVNQRVLVRLSFNRHLRNAMFDGVGVAGQSQQVMRFEDLKLFEEEDLDESIEIARAQQEIAFVVDDALPELDALMSTLLGWITVQPQINPLRPEIYVRAMRECFAEQITDVDTRGSLITPAAGRLGILLRKLYTELSSWLKTCGVESAGTLQPGQTQSSVAKPGVVAGVGNSVARTLLTLDRLRRLLSGELDGDTSGVRRPQDFLHTVPASVVALQDMRQVEAMVQRLEVKARQAALNPDADAARKKAAARIAMMDGKKLGKQLGEEVVRLMLDNLIQDERLLAAVRAQLQTLEPLLMQIAKADGRFFSDRQHAARQFLDMVTSRSLGFTSERDDGFARFLASIEKTISLINKKTEAGEEVVAAFSQTIQKLQDQWARDDEHERARHEEAARALLHAEQRNMLAQYLAQEFRQNAEGIDVPKHVVDFVCGPWAQVVAESQLRCTDGTSDPQGYMDLVDELYWSVQPKVARRNRTRLVQMIPGLLTQLRQGLMVIDFPPERIADFFEELIAQHEAALEGGRPKPVPAIDTATDTETDTDTAHQDANPEDPARDAAQAITSPGALEPASGAASDATMQDEEDEGVVTSQQPPEFWMAAHEASEAGFLEEEAMVPMDMAIDPSARVLDAALQQPVGVTTLPIGSWVELMLEARWVRAQLTWASPHRSFYMFTSRGGLAHSMSKRTMERLLAKSLIRVVAAGHLVDKALDAVAQTALKNSLQTNPPASEKASPTR